ncbi:MAG: DUF4231 domain-containing protein [Bacteroidota bacterium]
MSVDDYLKDRLEDQLNWHDRKSAWNQKRYKTHRIVIILSSVLIPFLSGLITPYDWMSYVVGFLGVIIAATEGRLQVFKYLENWTKYRGTAESLRREKYFFQTNTGPYAQEENNLAILVERTEKILENEQESWYKRITDE